MTDQFESCDTNPHYIPFMIDRSTPSLHQHAHTSSLSSTVRRQQANRPPLPSIISTTHSNRSTWWSTNEAPILAEQDSQDLEELSPMTELVEDPHQQQRLIDDIKESSQIYKERKATPLFPSFHPEEQKMTTRAPPSEVTHSTHIAMSSTIDSAMSFTAEEKEKAEDKDIRQMWKYASFLLSRPPSALSFAKESDLARQGAGKRWSMAGPTWSSKLASYKNGPEVVSTWDSDLDPHSVAHGIVDYVDDHPPPPQRRGSTGTIFTFKGLMNVQKRSNDHLPTSVRRKKKESCKIADNGKICKPRFRWWLILLCLFGVLISAALIVLGCLLHRSGDKLVF